MSERLNDYLIQETAEYLDELEHLLALPGPPNAERLLGLARGVAGSAQMAGAGVLVRLAERLEDAVRTVLTSQVTWSEDVRYPAAQTVRDLQVLIRSLGRWGAAEETRVRSAMDRLDDLARSASPAAPSGDDDVVPVSSFFFDDSGPHVLSPEPESADSDSDSVVPVELLLLSGQSALREAVRLRERVERELRARNEADSPLGQTLAELFDLLELALPAGSGSP